MPSRSRRAREDHARDAAVGDHGRARVARADRGGELERRAVEHDVGRGVADAGVDAAQDAGGHGGRSPRRGGRRAASRRSAGAASCSRPGTASSARSSSSSRRTTAAARATPSGPRTITARHRPRGRPSRRGRLRRRTPSPPAARAPRPPRRPRPTRAGPAAACPIADPASSAAANETERHPHPDPSLNGQFPRRRFATSRSGPGDRPGRPRTTSRGSISLTAASRARRSARAAAPARAGPSRAAAGRPTSATCGAARRGTCCRSRRSRRRRDAQPGVLEPVEHARGDEVVRREDRRRQRRRRRSSASAAVHAGVLGEVAGDHDRRSPSPSSPIALPVAGAARRRRRRPRPPSTWTMRRWPSSARWLDGEPGADRARRP